jgi:hypothetical protein
MTVVGVQVLVSSEESGRDELYQAKKHTSWIEAAKIMEDIIPQSRGGLVWIRVELTMIRLDGLIITTRNRTC